MTRKQLLEKIKKEMSQDWSEQEKVAFIIMKIAEDRSFSEHYYWGDSATLKKMYSRTIKPKEVEPQNKRKLICTTVSRLFKYIATELGMEVLYVGEEGVPTKIFPTWLKNGEHLYPAVKFSDGKLIKCDIQRDLHNIQTGCQWQFFGTRGLGEYQTLSGITAKELEEIMQKIGYLKTRGVYTEELCKKQASEKTTPNTVTNIVREVFQDEVLNKEVAHKAIVETYKFYGKVFNIYFNERHKNYNGFKTTLELTSYMDSFFMFPCKLKKDGSIRYTLCAYTREQDEIGTIYLLSRTTRRMLEVSLQEMVFYQEQGLRIPNYGTRFLRKKLEELRNLKESMPSPQIDLEEFIDETADERQ